MEYYLDYLSILKYRVLVLYYWLAEFPPVIRINAIFITSCFLLLIIILIHNVIGAQVNIGDHRRKARFRRRYADKMRQVALTPEDLTAGEITSILGLPQNLKVKRKEWERCLPVFRQVIVDVKDSGTMNWDNWKTMLQVFKMPTYFERQIQSRKVKYKIAALKDVSDIACDLKEATASRYLYAKDDQLRLTARLHGARYGIDNPFGVFTENSNAIFTEEMCTKLHWVCKYRQAVGLSVPNFIRWCTDPNAHITFRLFALREIRLFHATSDGPELLKMLKECRDERLATAIIETLGSLHYVEAEDEFFRRYDYAGSHEKIALAKALGTINSGNPKVIRFLVEDYKESTDTLSKVKLLTVLYNYGPDGLAAFYKLKTEVPAHDLHIFEHVECKLIDSTKYA